MMTGEQDLRNIPAAILGRAGVVRILRRAFQGLAEGLLHGGIAWPSAPGSLRRTASHTTIAANSPPANT